MRKNYTIIYLFLIFSGFALAQPKNPTNSAYEGTHFMIGFMQNEIAVDDWGLTLEVFITSKSQTNIRVRDFYNFDRNFLIKADSILIVEVPNYNITDDSEVPIDNAIEIISDFPVSVWGYNSMRLTTDAFAAIPIKDWGKEYMALTVPNDQYRLNPYPSAEDSVFLLTPRSSQFMVVASEDNTTIEFQPKSITRNGKQTYNKYYATLNKGQVYLVQSYLVERGYGDLSGTIVKGNKPFGFFSGHVRSSIPQDIPTDSKNHLVEMLLPTNSWGNDYVSVPFGLNSCGDLIRINNIQPKTTVYCQNANGFKTYYLENPGTTISIPNFNIASRWFSDKPIQIGQFMMHDKITSNDKLFDYDPSFVALPATNSYTNYAVFLNPFNPGNNKNKFDGHRITIVAEDCSLPTLTIDNQLLTSLSNIANQKIDGTNLHWARINLSPGKHIAKCDKGSFSGIVFGYGFADAYSYILGSTIFNPFAADTSSPIISFHENCGKINGTIKEVFNKNTSGLLYPLIIIDSTYNYKWSIDSTKMDSIVFVNAQPIDITKDGKFSIEIRDKNGNGKKSIFYYEALKVKMASKIDFGEVSSTEEPCKFYNIINYGSDTLLVNSIIINDPRIDISKNNFPFYIFPDDTAIIHICFKPGTKIDTLKTTAVVEFSCGNVNVNILGSVYLNNLVTSNWNFGEVLLGDTVCHYVFITNQGSKSVKIYNLDFALNSEFIIDSVGLLPKVLNANDTLLIKVCFAPNTNFNKDLDIFYNNELSPYHKSLIQGRGISPNINSIFIDFFKRRIGTINDTTFEFINTGNAKTNLLYSRIILDNNEFDKNEIYNINHAIKVNDTLKIKTSYNPQTKSIAKLEAEVSSDWKLHKPISIVLQGEGTLPEIKTYDYDFGNVYIKTSKNENVAILKSGGNENLTIESIKILSGDINDFIINISNLKNLILIPDSTLSIPITFNPQSIGRKEIILEIIHDANPNYKRSSSFVKISGFGVVIDYEIKLEIDKEFNVCNNNSGKYYIKNIGNIPFSLDSNIFKVLGCSYTEKILELLPKKLDPDSIYIGSMEFYNISRQDIEIAHKTVINDTIVNTKTNKYQTKRNEIFLNSIENYIFAPGDTNKLSIGGKFLSKTERDFKFSIKIKVDQKTLFFLEKEILLKYGKNGEKSVKCVLNQSLDELYIESVEKIFLENENIIWSIEIPFLVLLNDVKQSAINIIITENDCFEQNAINVTTELEDVCVYNFRNIRLIKDFARFSFEIKEKEGIIVLNTDLTEDDIVNFTIFDLNGKKILEKPKYYLHKGNQSVIFEINSFASGVYLFSIETSRLINRKMIVLTK